MKFCNGIFPKSIIAGAYLAGIVTVLVFCCSTDNAWRTVSDVVSGTVHASDDGGVQPSDLSVLAFVFHEDAEEIVGVTASVHEDATEVPLENVGSYRADGVLVVETQAEIGRAFCPHFYFLNHMGEVVKEYQANVFVNRSLITYHDQNFGEDEQFPYHNQPEEIEAEVGDKLEITLKSENRLWSDGKFHDLWQVIRLPAGSHAISPSTELVEIDQPFSVGISSDNGISGETVISLEVLSQ